MGRLWNSAACGRRIGMSLQMKRPIWPCTGLFAEARWAIYNRSVMSVSCTERFTYWCCCRTAMAGKSTCYVYTATKTDLANQLFICVQLLLTFILLTTCTSGKSLQLLPRCRCFHAAPLVCDSGIRPAAMIDIRLGLLKSSQWRKRNAKILNIRDHLTQRSCTATEMPFDLSLQPVFC